jgi:hypothetical protein
VIGILTADIGLVALNLHFLGDVIAGSFVGVSTGLFTVALWRARQLEIRKTASRRFLRNPIRCFNQPARAVAFFFLRQPRRPKAPRPLAKSGSTANYRVQLISVLGPSALTGSAAVVAGGQIPLAAAAWDSVLVRACPAEAQLAGALLMR